MPAQKFFEKIDVDRGRARGPKSGTIDPVAIPGYYSGFNVLLNDDLQPTVGPGVIAIRGELVSVTRSTVVTESNAIWEQERQRAQFYYVYLDIDGSFFISPLPPSYDRESFHEVYQGYNTRVCVGHMFVGNSLATLLAVPGSARRYEVSVISGSQAGRADYYCDGTGDDVQINLALDYQTQANLGGTVQFSSGGFVLSQDISLAGAFLNIQGTGPSTVLTGANITGHTDIAQIRELTHFYEDVSTYYTGWGGAATNRSETPATDNAGDIDTDTTDALEIEAGGAIILRTGSDKRMVVSGAEISVQELVSDVWTERVEISAGAILVGGASNRVKIAMDGSIEADGDVVVGADGNQVTLDSSDGSIDADGDIDCSDIDCSDIDCSSVRPNSQAAATQGQIYNAVVATGAPLGRRVLCLGRINNGVDPLMAFAARRTSSSVVVVDVFDPRSGFGTISSLSVQSSFTGSCNVRVSRLDF